VISVSLDRLKSTWLIQLLGAYDVRNYENVDGIQALILKYLFRLPEVYEVFASDKLKVMLLDTSFNEICVYRHVDPIFR